MPVCPAGANAAAAIGDIMGVSVTASERMVPVLHCNGTCDSHQPEVHV